MNSLLSFIQKLTIGSGQPIARLAPAPQEPVDDRNDDAGDNTAAVAPRPALPTAVVGNNTVRGNNTANLPTVNNAGRVNNTAHQPTGNNTATALPTGNNTDGVNNAAHQHTGNNAATPLPIGNNTAHQHTGNNVATAAGQPINGTHPFGFVTPPGRGRGNGRTPPGRGRGNGRTRPTNGRAGAIAADAQQRTIANQAAAGDREVIHIDEIDSADLRKKRAPDSIDVMDKMTAGLTACVSQLTTALSNRPQRQPVQPPTPQPPTPIHQPPQTRVCLSDKIESP